MSKLFSCFICTGIMGDKSSVTVLVKLKKATSDGSAIFAKRLEEFGISEETRDDFRKAWKEDFEQFPDALKHRLMECFFKDVARAKGLSDEANAQKFIEDSFQSKESKENARNYVKLLMSGTTTGFSSVDPCSEEELPSYFVQIERDIDAEIKMAQETQAQ